MASPTYAAVQNQDNPSSSTTYQGTIPAGTVAGHVLLAQISVRGSSTASMNTVPSGWTLAQVEGVPTGTVSAFTMWTYWKVATATEVPLSTVDWVGSFSDNSSVTISRYSGAARVGASGTQENAAGTGAFPQVTTSDADSLLVYMSGIGGGISGTVAAPLTERWDLQAGNTSDRLFHYGATEVQAAAGLSTQRSYNQSTSVSNAAMTLEVMPFIPKFRGADVATTDAGTSVTVPLPPGIQEGDAQFAFIGYLSDLVMPTPTGWTLVDKNTASANVEIAIYRRYHQSGNGSTSFTTDATATVIAAVTEAWYDVDPADPVHLFSEGFGDVGTTTGTAPALTTTIPNTKVLRIFTTRNSAGSTATANAAAIGTPTNHVERAEAQAGGGNISVPRNTAASDITQGASGAVGTANSTFSVSAFWAATTLALKPAPDPAAGYPTAGFNFAVQNHTATFTNTSTGGGGTITGYLWDFGDGGATSTATNPTKVYAANGEYTVALTVTNSLGLTSTTHQTVTVDRPGAPTNLSATIVAP